MTSVQACGNITGTFDAQQPPATTSRATGLKGISLHGRPVDQGIEHSAGASFAPNPIYFDPEKIDQEFQKILQKDMSLAHLECVEEILRIH
jgi:hypothetical protein